MRPTPAALAAMTVLGTLPPRTHPGSKPARPGRRQRAAAHKARKRLRRAGQRASGCRRSR